MMGFFPKPPWRRLMNKATQCLTKIMFCKKNDILMTTPFLFRFSIVVSVYKGIQIENVVFHNVDTSSVCVCVKVAKCAKRALKKNFLFSGLFSNSGWAGWRRCWKARSFVLVIWEPHTASPIIGNQSKDLQFANMTSRMKMILFEGKMQFQNWMRCEI